MMDFGGKVKHLHKKTRGRLKTAVPHSKTVCYPFLSFGFLPNRPPVISLTFRPSFSLMALPLPVCANAKISTPATTATSRKMTPPEPPASSYVADFCAPDAPFSLFSALALPVCGP